MKSVVARESQHTKLPWEREDSFIFASGDDSRRIADCHCDDQPMSRNEEEANAEFIVRACNSHQALVEALQAIHDYATRLRSSTLPGFLGSSADTYALKVLEQAEQALRLAQGEK